MPHSLAILSLLAVTTVGLADPVVGQRRLGSYVRRAFDYRAVEVGVIGGPNRTTVTGAGPIDPNIRGSLGAFVSVRLGEGFRLRPEVLVTGKRVGAEPFSVLDQPGILRDCLPNAPCPQSIDFETVTLTWIEAPLLLEYRFGGLGRAVSPRLYGGPFLALRVGCSESLVLLNPSERLVRSCGEQTALSPQYNNGDGGFVLGGAVARRGVAVGLRWTRSLAEVAPFQASVSRLVGAKQSTLTATLEFSTRLW